MEIFAIGLQKMLSYILFVMLIFFLYLHWFDQKMLPACCVKGLVHQKINYSTLRHSKPIRPLFIFETQIKIFFDEIRELSDPS